VEVAGGGGGGKDRTVFQNQDSTFFNPTTYDTFSDAPQPFQLQ